MSDPRNPLIVQADRSIFLEVHAETADAARQAIAPFTELEKSPEHLHTYRVTPLSIWNACSAGLTGEAMVAALERHAKYPLPSNVTHDLYELAARYGRLRLLAGDETPGVLLLTVGAADADLLTEVCARKAVRPLVGERAAPTLTLVPAANRGLLKQALLEAGWPILDEAGFADGGRLPITILASTRVREYQTRAAEAFHQSGSALGGSGVIVLPPGSGKTVVGILAMALVGARTLILTTNRTSVEQWRRELLERTTLEPEQITEFGSGRKRPAPVTISTYQMVTRRSRGEDGDLGFVNMEALSREDWGLIIYDEVHLLPAPVFRMAVEVQARRRLGLTATLLREDGREGDVFSLIGPKRFDMPWKDLEHAGWIAPAVCCEVRVPLPPDERLAYAVAEDIDKYRIAAENPEKRGLVQRIVALHDGAPTLVIGSYLGQLDLISRDLEAPLITGRTPHQERERLFQRFREGGLNLLVLSRVGNFALDLPEAQVLVQVSGAFGSRQEEAQRLGRLLRPKARGETALFYTLVSRETREEDFAAHRQLFLTEQGYTYRILHAHDLTGPHPTREPSSIN